MSLPPITELLPHRPPMLLVDEVIRHEGLRVTCRTTIREDMPFVSDGQAPMLVALELFAQSACSLVALLAVGRRTAMMGGAFLGTRKVALHADALFVGDVVDIHCEERMAIGPTAQIECRLERAGELLAEGAINVMAGTP
ncbi:MAG: hypothetical protein KF729_19015 [Sandaracinaceae bacterium]|nr:hypothetical protein [Sandaracinaceae bacterium]